MSFTLLTFFTASRELVSGCKTLNGGDGWNQIWLRSDSWNTVETIHILLLWELLFFQSWSWWPLLAFHFEVIDHSVSGDHLAAWAVKQPGMWNLSFTTSPSGSILPPWSMIVRWMKRSEGAAKEYVWCKRISKLYWDAHRCTGLCWKNSSVNSGFSTSLCVSHPDLGHILPPWKSVKHDQCMLLEWWMKRFEGAAKENVWCKRAPSLLVVSPL